MVTNVLEEHVISIFRAEVYKTLHCHNQIPKSEFMIKLYDVMDWINGAQFFARELTSVCVRYYIQNSFRAQPSTYYIFMFGLKK